MPSLKTRFVQSACIALLLCMTSLCLSQQSAITLFSSDTVTNVILETDLKLLVKNKYKEDYQPARLGIIGAPGDTTFHEVEVRSRGNMRKEVCYYPPVFIRFSKKQYDHHKIKCVNICRNTDVNESYLLKEYLAYKMYSALTDKALDAYLLNILYIDTGKNEKIFQRHAFVLQTEDELAEEFDGRVYEPKILQNEMLNREQLALFTFFQYMIGNTDWAFGNSHNLLVFTHAPTNTLIPVAYDFDYSGLVNATYAVPHGSIPVADVTVRYNKGYCIDEALCEQMRQLFLSRKEDILACCNNLHCMSPKDRDHVVNYLEPFFRMLEKPKEVSLVFGRDCREME